MKKVIVILILGILCGATPMQAVSPYGIGGASGLSGHSSASSMPTVTMRSTSVYRTQAASSASGYSMRGAGSTSQSAGFGSRGSVYTPSYGSVRTMVNTTYRPGENVMASKVMGVTAADTYGNINGAMNRGVRRSPDFGGDGEDEECDQCIDLNSDRVCDRCGCAMDGCTCEDESGYCWCPVGDGVDVWVMMAMMAIAYGIYGAWNRKKELPEC